MSDFNLSEAQKIVIELQIARKELMQANETVTKTLALLQKQTRKIEVLVNTVKLIDSSVLAKKIQKIDEASQEKSCTFFVVKTLVLLGLAASIIFYYFYMKNQG